MITEKQMKIVNAVNRTCGESLVGSNGEIYIVISKKDHPACGAGYITLTKSHIVDDRLWDLVCTIAEYNQCIEEMKCHYGIIKYHCGIPKWFSYNRADKELLTVENSDYSFYEKEKFVYGQDVYVKGMYKNSIKLKFGCIHVDGERAILFSRFDSVVLHLISEVSSKPFKSKADIELEAKEGQVIDMISLYYDAYYASDIKGLFNLMQENGDLAAIKLTEEE